MIRRIANALIFLLILSSSAFAQYSGPGYTQPPSGSQFVGGTITSPVLGQLGCVNPAYSFTGFETSGLCIDVGLMYVKHVSGDQTAQALFAPSLPLISIDASDTSDGTNAGVSINGTLANVGVLDFAFVGSNSATRSTSIAGGLPRITDISTNGVTTVRLNMYADVESATLTSTGSGTFGELNLAPTEADLSVSNASSGVGVSMIAGEGVFVSTSGSKPTCDSTKRGRMWRTEGGAGVADSFEACTKDAADVYAWRSLLP